MRITLTPGEYQHAAYAGFVRQVQNICAGRTDAHAYTGGGYDIHVLGAVGEFVVARALGRFWAGPGALRAADVGMGAGGLQVRTSHRPDARLIVHPGDPNDDVFVLVTGTALAYTISGWLLGRDAKQRAYWTDPAGGRPAYFVPRAALRSIDQLCLQSEAV